MQAKFPIFISQQDSDSATRDIMRALLNDLAESFDSTKYNFPEFAAQLFALCPVFYSDENGYYIDAPSAKQKLIISQYHKYPSK